METADLLGLLLMLTGTAIVLGCLYARLVVGDLRPARECVKCGELAVFGRSNVCRFCGYHQTEIPSI